MREQNDLIDIINKCLETQNAFQTLLNTFVSNIEKKYIPPHRTFTDHVKLTLEDKYINTFILDTSNTTKVLQKLQNNNNVRTVELLRILYDLLRLNYYCKLLTEDSILRYKTFCYYLEDLVPIFYRIDGSDESDDSDESEELDEDRYDYDYDFGDESWRDHFVALDEGLKSLNKIEIPLIIGQLKYSIKRSIRTPLDLFYIVGYKTRHIIYKYQK